MCSKHSWWTMEFCPHPLEEFIFGDNSHINQAKREAEMNTPIYRQYLLDVSRTCFTNITFHLTY